ncbi:MAG: hypothetical protein LBR60_01865 [Fibrobacter sp.]|jgi:uncharacterized protein YbaR (Trm112 family)|nr:hypothetical protein [Fibrobacter sp.]
MISPELLEILCCPETKQPLREAGSAELDTVNGRIRAGSQNNAAGEPVKEILEAALITADGKRLYPVKQGIPVLLSDEALLMQAKRNP